MNSLIESNKFKQLLMMLFNGLFILTFAYIWINITIHPNDVFYNMKNWMVVLGAIILFGLLFFIAQGLKRIKNPRYLVLISLINLFIIIGLQIFFVKYFRVNLTWDFGDIFYSALELKDQFIQLQPYFYFKYPNNIPILLLYVAGMRFLDVFGVSRYLECFIALNMLVILLSLICLYIFVCRRTNYYQATLLSFFMLFITPLYTYTTIVYTDTLTIIFPILSLLIYDFFYHSKNHSLKYVWLVLLGVVIAVGTLLKANVIITLVAIVIHYFMTKRWMKSLLFIVALLIPFAITNYAYEKVIEPIIPVERSELGFPSTHWVMMGLHHEGKVYGGYYHEDVNFTSDLKSSGLTNKQLSERHLQMIKSRLSQYGVRGYLEFLSQKINYTWGEGTYYAPEKLSRSPLRENGYQPYIFGDQKGYFVYASQMAHLLMMSLVVIASFDLFKKRVSFEQVLSITLFGVFLFLLIWETRSRYLVLYLPVILALASEGLSVTTTGWSRK